MSMLHLSRLRVHAEVTNSCLKEVLFCCILEQSVV